MATAQAARVPGGVPHAFLYLLPGLAGFIIIVLVPAIMNAGISLLTWKGVGIPKFVGLTNYTKLLADDAFWSSLQHTLAFIVAMAIIPTMLGIFLAAVLFDYVSSRFGQGWSSFFRAGFYLPQILPISRRACCGAGSSIRSARSTASSMRWACTSCR